METDTFNYCWPNSLLILMNLSGQNAAKLTGTVQIDTSMNKLALAQ
jgi:hypothetical protein